MRIFKLLLLCVFVLGLGSVNAQTKLKFGHINTQKILANLPELKTIDAQLKVEYTKLGKQLTDMQDALKKTQMDYAKRLKTLSATEKATLLKSIQQKNKNVQTFYQQSQKGLQEKEQKLKAPIIKKVTDAIQQVGEENGFLYIFEDAAGLAVYKSAKSIDVSDLVKAKLAKK